MSFILYHLLIKNITFLMEMKIFLNIGVLTIHLQRIQRSAVLPKETN